VGSPLKGLPLTRFPGRGWGVRRHRPWRTTPRRSSRRRRLGRPGRPDRRFPWRGRMRRCPAECPRRWPRPAAEAQPSDPHPEAEEGAVRDRGRSCAPPRRHATRARAPGPRGTGRGTPTPSDLSGRKRSRPPAGAAPVSKRASSRRPHRVARAPRRAGTGAAGRSTNSRCRPAAGPGYPAPECPCRGPPRCGRGTSPGVNPTRVVVAIPTRASGCRPEVPGRPRPDRVRWAPPTRRGRRPTQRVPPPSRSP